MDLQRKREGALISCRHSVVYHGLGFSVTNWQPQDVHSFKQITEVKFVALLSASMLRGGFVIMEVDTRKEITDPKPSCQLP